MSFTLHVLFFYCSIYYEFSNGVQFYALENRKSADISCLFELSTHS